MRNIAERDYTRRPDHFGAYRREAERMQQPATPEPPVPSDAQDTMILLPLLLLLMREQADRWLLLALVYILM